jgi:hypothetical protein
MKSKDLDDRIASAFTDDSMTSIALAGLLAEAEAALMAAKDAAETARSKALDPTLPVSELSAARRAIDDTNFRRDRLEAATQRLADRLERLKVLEIDQRRKSACDAANRDRAAILDDLARLEPAVREFAAVVARIGPCDQATRRLVLARQPGQASFPLHGRVADGASPFMRKILEGWLDSFHSALRELPETIPPAPAAAAPWPQLVRG